MVHVPKPRQVNMLFIGNSYTYFNNLPVLVEQIAHQSIPNLDIKTKRVTVGGATLQDLWKGGDALQAVKTGKWDFVVLQDQSTLGMTFLVNGLERIVRSPMFEEYGRKFAAEIRAVHAVPVFYETWKRKIAPPRDQVALNYEYMRLAKTLGAKIVPVGTVWKRTEDSIPGVELYWTDGSHPSQTGSYVAAVTFVTKLFGPLKRPLPTRIEGTQMNEDGDATGQGVLAEIPKPQAEVIGKIAEEMRKDSLKRGGYLPAPNPGPIQMPALPKASEMRNQEIADHWVGQITLFPLVFGKATLDITVERKDYRFVPTATITLENVGEPMHPEIAEIHRTPTGVEFTDEKGVSGAKIFYRGVWVGDTLQGVATLLSPDPRLGGIGLWELRRAPKPL